MDVDAGAWLCVGVGMRTWRVVAETRRLPHGEWPASGGKGTSEGPLKKPPVSPARGSVGSHLQDSYGVVRSGKMQFKGRIYKITVSRDLETFRNDIDETAIVTVHQMHR